MEVPGVLGMMIWCYGSGSLYNVGQCRTDSGLRGIKKGNLLHMKRETQTKNLPNIHKIVQKNSLICCTDIKNSLNLHRIQVLPAREPDARLYRSAKVSPKLVHYPLIIHDFPAMNNIAGPVPPVARVDCCMPPCLVQTMTFKPT